MKLPALANWAKILWAFGAVALAFVSANASILAADRRAEAGILSGIHPSDGVLVQRQELQAIAQDPAHKIDQERLGQIRSTLHMRPLNVQTLALLAISTAGPGGSSPESERTMLLAQKVSRREPISQMWMIEKASAANDVPEALRHYHILLSTNPNLNGTLFPILAAAIDFPEVQKAMRDLLMKNPSWKIGFLPFAASNAKLDSYLGMIGSSYEILRDPIFMPANSELTYRLASEGRGEEALNFARMTLENFDVLAFKSIGFSPATTDPNMGRLAWLQGTADNSTVSFDESGVAVTIEPGASSDVLSRSLIVKPAPAFVYAITIEVGADSKPASIKLLGRCAQKASASTDASWETDIPVVSGKTSHVLAFKGLEGCSLVQLGIRAVGADSQLPSVFRIRDLSLDQQ